MWIAALFVGNYISVLPRSLQWCRNTSSWQRKTRTHCCSRWKWWKFGTGHWWKCLSVFSVEVGVSASGSECRAHGCIAKQKASRGGWRGRKWLTGLVRSLPHSHTSQPENVKKMAGMNIASPSFSCRLCIVTYNTDVGCGCGSCQTASPRLWPFFLLQHSLFLSCCRCWRSGIDSAWHYVDARRCLFRFGSHA